MYQLQKRTLFIILLREEFSPILCRVFCLLNYHPVSRSLRNEIYFNSTQVTGKFRGGYNPFSKHCCYNCCNTLCGPHYPSLKQPSKYVGKKPRKYTIPARPYPPSSGNLSALSAAANNSVATSGGNNDPQVCLHHHQKQQERLHELQQQGRGSIDFRVLIEVGALSMQ